MNRTLLLPVLALLFVADQLYAGSGNRTGTNGASEMLIPVGTRAIGMAGATVSTSAGVEALFINPAGAAWMSSDVGIYASHMIYLADIGVSYAAVSAKFESFGVLSLDMKALSFGDISLTTTLTPDGTGQTFSPTFLTFGLTYSRKLTDRISVGVTGMLITERIADVSANGFAFSAGVLYEGILEAEGLNFGVVVKNIGPQMKFEGSGLNINATPTSLGREEYLYKVEAATFELPSVFEVGVGYAIPLSEAHAVQLAAAFQNNNFLDDEYKVGLEYGFKEVFFVRGGYNHSAPESDRRENIFGATFGAGIRTLLGSTDVRFDYAYRQAKFFDGNHIFSVMLQL